MATENLGYCGRCDEDEVALCEHELCSKCCGCGGEDDAFDRLLSPKPGGWI